MTRRDRLIIACVGNGSLHPHWLEGAAERTFDLFLVYYGDEEGRWREHADHYLAAKGAKYQLLDRVAREHGDVVGRYRTIWLPDDDIMTSADNINAMFELFEAQRLEVGQPALSKESFVNVPLTRRMPFVALRYTRCVEIMVPLFSGPAFEKLAWTFGETRAAWGIDWIWVRVVNEGGPEDGRKVGILDATPVTHTRKQDLSAGFYSRLPVHPHDEMTEMLERHGLSDKPGDVRSFLAHEAGVRVGDRVFVMPAFPEVRLVMWKVYDRLRRRWPSLQRLARRIRDLYIGRQGEPSIL